jgi:hypothetical protein
MLFSYTYVPHQIDKMQAFIDFIFYAVWCQAPSKGPYHLKLFAPNPELFDVMTALHYDDSKGALYFAGHVQRVYSLFATLTPVQVEQLRLWYVANNDIERVCANDSIAPIGRYGDFPAELEVLRDQLASFFKGLYSHLGIAALKKWIGDIDDHYQAFMSVNKAGKCPFCGINDLLGPYHSRREAYDHYLPKALYPFNTVNFKNLAPACHHCNSSYKTSWDVAYQVKDPAGKQLRRKAFYPYSVLPYKVGVLFTLANVDLSALEPHHISVQFGPAELQEQIDTWRDVYGIDERYKGKLCGENDGKYWLEQALGEWKENGRDPQELVAEVHRSASKRPYGDCNFLKAPFLAACQANGAFA